VTRAGDLWVSGLDTETGLPPDLQERFLHRATLVRARAHQIILAEGSDTDEVYLITRGRVQVSIFSPNGRETILREMGPGRLIGELAALLGERRTASVLALENTEFACISAAAFRDFLAIEPGAGLWIAQQLASRVKNLTTKTREFATMPIGHRVQSELLRLAMHAGIEEDAGTIAALPTHADFAARIGTHREAVTRELGLLTREGIIAQSGRTLRILSISKLMAVAARTAR